MINNSMLVFYVQNCNMDLWFWYCICPTRSIFYLTIFTVLHKLNKQIK